MSDSKFLTRLKRGSLGRRVLEEIEREEATAQSAATRRATLAAERHLLQKGLREEAAAAREELEELRAERSTLIRGLAPRFVAAQARLTKVEERRRRIARIERELLDVEHPGLADAGPLFEGIGAALGHLQSHRLTWAARSTVARQERELAGAKLDLAPGFELKSEVEESLAAARRRLELDDAAAELVPAFEAARKGALELQLAPEPDLAAARQLVKGLPKACPCGHDFAFRAPEAGGPAEAA